MEKEVNLEDRIKGSIYGLLIGDALGVPYEFHPAASIPRFDEIELEPPSYFRPSHNSTPPGTWSDDGAQALVLLESLLKSDGFDPSHFASGLINWHDNGYMAIDQIVFDVGNQTERSINSLKLGVQPILAGGTDESSNGNGSLMRVLPLALWHTGSSMELIESAFAQSSITHGHIRAKLCCAIYCLWARAILEGVAEPWEYAVETTFDNFPVGTLERGELDRTIRPLDKDHEIRGSGYVVDSLRAARWATAKPSYEETVRAAISLGEDTDTTACIAGGIAGLIHGFQSIPERWFMGLRGKEIAQPLVSNLISQRQ